MGKKFDLRTGVIGVGSMGQNHARVYKEISDFVAVADSNEEQGRKVAERFNVDWYSDYRQMLDEVDAVTISVPTSLHRVVAEEVAVSGVHLLVEKPLAGNVTDADAIVKAANKARVKLAVGHIERHNPAVAYAKKAIERGDWGDIITMSSRRVSRFPQRIKDVGVILDLAIHDIDIMCYLVGSNVLDILSMKGHKESQVYEDHATILLDFENQTKGICEVNWLTPIKIRKLSLTCTKAFVNIDLIDQVLVESSAEFINTNDENLYKVEQAIKTEKIIIPSSEPLRLELIDFLKCIDSKNQPLVSGVDGRNVVELAERTHKK